MAKGRGLDFEHRFRTSRWAEDLLQDALNRSGRFLCFKLGLSQVAVDNRPDPGDATFKEPDLVIFHPQDLTGEERQWLKQTDLTQMLPRDLLGDPFVRVLLAKARCAIEVEFSPYKASEMKDRAWIPKHPDDLLRRPRKHANPPTAPNIWVKLEDLPRLQAWERAFNIPIVVAHLFDQEAFAVPLATLTHLEAHWPDSAEEAVRLQLTTGIFRKIQSYDRVDAQGAGETKVVFVVSPAAAQPVGTLTGVAVTAQIGLSSSKKYVAHVLFEGGALTFSDTFLDFLSARHA
jgi:hypothetical protein